MDLPHGDDRTKKFVSNVGLITSNGPYGNNVMACEWVHQISYSPGLMAISLTTSRASYENIKQSKEFGISIASNEQNTLSSLSGGSSAKVVDKINAFKELGYKFYKAKKINTLMVEGASLNMECKLVNEVVTGDHVLLIGEVVEVKLGEKEPLAYHAGKYWKIDNLIPKPAPEKLANLSSVLEKHRKGIVKPVMIVFKKK